MSSNKLIFFKASVTNHSFTLFDRSSGFERIFARNDERMFKIFWLLDNQSIGFIGKVGT